MSKKINEALVSKIMDKIIDKLKKGNVKQVKKNLNNKELTKSIDEFNKSYDELQGNLEKYYGKEWMAKIDKKTEDDLANLKDSLGIK